MTDTDDDYIFVPVTKYIEGKSFKDIINKKFKKKKLSLVGKQLKNSLFKGYGNIKFARDKN